VHNVVHFADDAVKYGALDDVSAFCFENFLGRLVRLIKKPNQPLEQLVRRLLEQKHTNTDKTVLSQTGLSEEHHSKNVPSSLGLCRQFKQVTVNGISISVKPGNNCIAMGNDIVVVRNIVVKNEEIFLIHQKFCERFDFFSYPLQSSHLGIYLVLYSKREMLIGSLSEFKTKYVMLPHNDSSWTTFDIRQLLHS
jgi:hypothetical protein